MDKTDLEKRLDELTADELRRGFRIKELPLDLVAAMKVEGVAPFFKLRLRRETPAVKRKIGELVEKLFQKEMQDETILNDDKIMEIMVKRGAWSPEHDARIERLREETNALSQQLYSENVQEDAPEWADDLVSAAKKFRELTRASDLTEGAKDEMLQRFNRWLEWQPDRQAEFDAAYAHLQDLPKYSPDRDQQWLLDNHVSLEQVDLIRTCDDLADKLQRVLKLDQKRGELTKLNEKRSQYFNGSLESRRASNEQMARMYFTAERVNPEATIEAHTVLGPLAPTFEEVYNLPEEVIQWLLVESFFFHQGISDEVRPYLQTFGFIRAEREEEMSPDGASEPSDASPAPQSTSAASAPPALTLVDSSEPAAPSTSTTPS